MNRPGMRLIGSDGSPFVRKVRVVALERRIDIDYERIDAWNAQAELQRANPLGKVPCLILDDGAALFDSRVIVEYLDALAPGDKLIPSGERAAARVKTWEALADGMVDAAVLLRIEHWQRAQEQRDPAWIQRQTGKLDAALAALSRGLGDGQWCAEGMYSLADVALGCALGYLDYRLPDTGWRARHANLAQWADRLFARPSFAGTAPPAG